MKTKNRMHLIFCGSYAAAKRHASYHSDSEIACPRSYAAETKTLRAIERGNKTVVFVVKYYERGEI